MTGNSSGLLMAGVFFAIAVRQAGGPVSVGVVPGRGRVLARRGARGRWGVAAAWAVGVVAIAVSSGWHLVSGSRWMSVLLAVVAVSWGWALVENVRRRDDPARSERPWPAGYGHVEVVGWASAWLLITSLVAADLLDGQWRDGLPGLAGWCIIVATVVVAVRRSRRLKRVRATAPPLRRDAGHGRLVLRRPSDRWAFGLVLAVHLDSVLVAELRAGESSSLHVEAGEHELAFVVDGMGLAQQRVDVPTGGIVDAELVLAESDVTVARIADGPLVVHLTS